ncbi:MAG: THUMP domain-containing protein [Candidatus Aenigmatarchaeota archaeon]
MRDPECVLVRLGEIALKSPQVQRRMFGMLLDNVKAALDGIEYKMETNPNRIFIYTKQIDEAMERIKKIFGVTSVSPCWTCFSGLNDIRMIASDMASDVLKISEKNSFAIRAHRVGRHKFSSKEIAEEAGAAVKRVTGARVDLSNPDREIFIEARSRKTYAFVEKIPAVGGMPVGVSGGIISIIESPNDVIASWLMMKRGCEIMAITDEENMKLAQKLKDWDKQLNILTYEKNILENYLANIPSAKKTSARKILLIMLASLVAEKEGALGISSGIASGANLGFIGQVNGTSSVPVYMPLLLYPEKELKEIMKMIGIKAKSIKEKLQEIDLEKMSADIGNTAEQMLKSLKEENVEHEAG